MEPRISIITLGVSDLNRSLKFYRDGLGFPTTMTPDDGIIFFKTSGTCFALYPIDKLAEDVGPEFKVAPNAGFSGITLAHNARIKEDVDHILNSAVEAGGKLEKPAQDTFWGGYSGYFSDPDGYVWEIAYADSWKFNDDGSLIV